ncbi:MAG: hypothetical protein K9I69_01970 [Ignavibacteriales bacterium]|nr:hypothetical protein [Ignavibacteriales bacterium]MCF8306210.1 hypothetical protein [Ignavibacteriales bacterium]MCF8315931.1 hypothetical protein [Ignavibacteriales bacterium]MCF8437525.1 hypothetical protein [Ignavibacteriales bacterium]
MEPFKNLYNEEFIDELISEIKIVYPGFEGLLFRREVFSAEWDNLELKQRMRHITNRLHDFLPSEFNEALALLRAIAHKFKGLGALVFPDYVEVYGIKYPEVSAEALEEFTQYSTSEFAVRPFIIKYPDFMISKMTEWSRDSNEHLRRLSSEGFRPRLPWSFDLEIFKRNPSPLLPVLSKLIFDGSDYVRKSASNSLNDISKDHPGIVSEFTRQFLGKDIKTDKALKHACRTMLKKGDKTILSLFGVSERPELEFFDFTVKSKIVTPGERLPFVLEFRLQKPIRLRIEYKMKFPGKRGGSSQKIFKFREQDYESGTVYRIEGNYHFRDLTIRQVIPGEHSLTIIINGDDYKTLSFEVKEEGN